MKTLADDFNLLLSPLPWKASTEHDDEILDADGGDVGVTFPLTRGGVIVAVNHFDRLVAACKRAIERCDWCDGTGTVPPSHRGGTNPCSFCGDERQLLADVAAARQEGNHAK